MDWIFSGITTCCAIAGTAIAIAGCVYNWWYCIGEMEDWRNYCTSRVSLLRMWCEAEGGVFKRIVLSKTCGTNGESLPCDGDCQASPAP